MLLAGSEYAMLLFTPNTMQLQSVDSISVCMCLFTFDRTLFHTFAITQEVRRTVRLRPLFSFLQLDSQVSFVVDGKSVAVRLRTSGDERLFPLGGGDNTVYYNLPADVYQHGSCFRLHPAEFVGTILDMAVGGGYTRVELEGEHLRWQTCFETGSISITAQSNNENFEILRAATGRLSYVYLTKFFKQACGVAQLCTGLRVHIHENGLFIMRFELGSNVRDLVVTIVPVETNIKYF